MNRTYSKTIENDFVEVKNLIKVKTINYELDYKNIFDGLNPFHKYFYKFRDILEELGYQENNSYSAIQDGVEGIFDFVWLLILSRYKSSIIAFRSSIEILIKGLMREYCPGKETDRFSNNIEIIIKQLKSDTLVNLNASNEKKALSKFLEQNYTSEIRSYYKDLSGIVHGKYIVQDTRFSEYLHEITEVDVNYSKEQFNYIICISTNLLKLILELTIMINFEYLDENMNSYKFNLILTDLSNEFKKFKNSYL